MEFKVLDSKANAPKVGTDTAYLVIDNWNDYSFVTMFYLSLHDESGKYHKIGNVKIGFKGQDISKPTHSSLPEKFTSLPQDYFSLGADLDYYKNIGTELRNELKELLLTSLKDLVFDEKMLSDVLNEVVVRESLMRFVSLATIKGQFKRVMGGGALLTDYKFIFKREQENKVAGIELSFEVKAESKPSTNIHAIIGRNGVGKTVTLNCMIDSIINSNSNSGTFKVDYGAYKEKINQDYFSSLVSVSFSAFDPFSPPSEQPNPALGTCYHYIGLKDSKKEDKSEKNTEIKTNVNSNLRLKDLTKLYEEFVEGMLVCMSQLGKKERWIKAIRSLESDDNFAEMNLANLSNLNGEELKSKCLRHIKRMSSGHAVVILTITKLVETVEEKTLVLIDEPECHLHPPLLSAFIRTLNELLHDRNGVAIIATHSPVILQEIPKSCVWKIVRSGLEISNSRPEIETFSENVGILTREVFGLEVIKSGFHQLLLKSVDEGGTFEEILEKYNYQLGIEGKGILRALIFHRDRKAKK